MFHELNAWEEDGKFIADVAAANGTALFPNEDGSMNTHGETIQHLRRWTIDLTGATSEVNEEIYHFGAGAACGELNFAPKISGTEEADGYAMTLAHPPNSNTTELTIFHAQNIAAGSIARVIVPYRIPSGFHCNYYSTESSLYPSALQ